jgi:mono/diheme cytochrome c family protein
MNGKFIVAVLSVSAAVAAPASKGSGAVTFNKDVLPILQNRCQGCHRPGEIGPMSFMTYKDTRPWAKAIQEAVASKKMPPWFADPQYGHFSNDRSMSQKEIETVTAWAASGAPEGNAKDRPAAREFIDGWAMNKPDVVYQIPTPF